MSVFSLDFNTPNLAAPMNADKLTTAVNLKNLAMQLEGGWIAPITLSSKLTPVAASGTITLSSSSGVLRATINGINIDTASLAGTDTENAAALAVVINASVDALVAGIVTAANVAGVVTITAVDKTKTGNAITLAASGTGATASGARLTAGSDGTVVAYTY